MTHAIRIHKTGGPEVLSWEEVQLGKPGPGEARIRHTAVGLNFVDVYNRMGLYPQPLPSGLGGEGAGVVEDIGTGARRFFWQATTLSGISMLNTTKGSLMPTNEHTSLR